MSRSRRTATRSAVVIGAVLTMLGAAVVAYGSGPREDSPTTAARGVSDAAGTGPARSGRAEGQRSLDRLQARLRAVPKDDRSWAALGLGYVQQARITADPSFYPKAEGAFARSLSLSPTDNYLALLGQGALAAARHDFAAALRLAQQAAAINPHSSSIYAVMGDALIELGRYPLAFEALQKMVDLSPDTSSFARVSYAWELRGNLGEARADLVRAREQATGRSDVAFTEFYLGELAFNAGDLRTARQHYDAAVAADSSYVPGRAGLAKVQAATGETEAALKGYAAVTSELPQPGYLIEYGDLLSSLGRKAEAAAQYELVRVESALFQAQGVNTDLELALFDADHGRPGEALATARAERSRRASIAVEDALAWALHKNGRDREALSAAKRATSLGMRNASFYYHRGAIELGLGMRADAARDLALALDINPYFSPTQAPLARAALEQAKR